MGMNQLVPTALATAHSTAATFTTPIATVKFSDNVGVQYTWTSTTAGTVTVELSLNPTVLGWYTYTPAGTPTQPAGSPGTGWIEIPQTTAAFVRVTYTRSAGSGAMDIWITAKAV